MYQMLFAMDESGLVVPINPALPDGTVLQPDGKEILTVAQAAELSGRPQEVLRKVWMRTYREILTVREENTIEGGDPIVVAEATADAPASVVMPTGPQGSTVPPLAVPPLMSASERAVLRVLKYPDLDDTEFTYLEQYCRAKKLNLWCKHLYTRKLYDEPSRKWKLEIIATADAMLLMAKRSGDYGGVDRPGYEYEDRKPGGPKFVSLCHRTVYRFIHGQRVPFTAEAAWEEYAPLSYGDIAERMPRNFLARCALVAALRLGFPDETGGIYSPEEMERASEKTPSGNSSVAAGSESPTAASGFEASLDHLIVEDDSISTRLMLDQKLWEEGLGTQAARDQAIEKFRKYVRCRMDPNHPWFFAAVLKHVRENRAFYGLEERAA